MAKQKRHQPVNFEGRTFWVDTLKVHREPLWLRQNGLCWICGRKMVKVARNMHGGPHDPDHATIDHLIPQAEGGSDDLANLALAHYRCNCLRGENMLNPLLKRNKHLHAELVTAADMIVSLERKLARAVRTNREDSLRWRTMRDERDDAIYALDRLRNLPPPPCPCWFCRLARAIRHNRFAVLAQLSSR